MDPNQQPSIYEFYGKDLYRQGSAVYQTASGYETEGGGGVAITTGTSTIPPDMIGSGTLVSNVQQTNGAIAAVKTNFDDNDAGFILGFDTDGTAKFLIGDASNSLYWNGTTLAIKGAVSASSIDIPNTTTANSFHVDTNGNAWWGATTLAGAVAKVLNTGAATFTSGSIGGWTIGATTLSSTNIVIDNANEKITVGSGADQITLNGVTGDISSAGATWSLAGDGTITGFLDYVVGAGTNAVKTYHNFVIPWVDPADTTTAIWVEVNMPLTYYYTYVTGQASLNSVASVITEAVFRGVGSSIGRRSFADGKSFVCEFLLDFVVSGSGPQGGFGVVSGVAPLNDYDDQTVDAACFTYDTSGNLYAHTANAGVGHTTTQITGITLGNVNSYRIEFNAASNVKFYINGVLKTTITTTLPDGEDIKFGYGASGNNNFQPDYCSAPAFAIQI